MSDFRHILYQPAFQIAYVTTDLDEAIRRFDDRYGVGAFLRRDGVRFPAHSKREMVIDLALAWVGPTMIELIAPRGGDDELYRQALPDSGFALRHHHVGFRLHSDEAWSAMLMQADARGQNVILEVETPTTRAVYLDTKAELGHYIEYLHYFDEAASSLPHIPQNAGAAA